MNVGIIGSGGGTCSLYFLKKIKKNQNIYCFPGNAGTSFIAKNIELTY